VGDMIEEFRDLDKLGQGFTSVDPLEEIDIGDGKTPRPTFVNKTLETDPRNEMIGLLKEYSDCFAWNYTEMPGLSREIVEHQLPIKFGFRPFKQRTRTFRPDLLPRIKDEIHRLLEADFIRPCRYAEWVSNIVPVEKELGKLRVCIDFHNLNRATGGFRPKAFGDSQLVVQQVLEEYQCFDGTLNSYLEKCWGIIHSFDEFSIRHICRVENHRANNLAQDASGYRIKRGRFHNTENLITGAGPILEVADCPSKDSRPSGVARKVLLIDSADNKADTSDWRTPIINYL
jgi:hypothetical protein